MTPARLDGGGRHCVVVGGGLAGISAALRLADAGSRVTLLEAKPRLGGLTTSLRRGQLEVDTGQHVFLRCCTSYRALLDRLGVTHLTTLQPRLDIPVVRASDGAHGRLRRDRLPVVGHQPLHLARSLLSYRLLTTSQRLAAARAMRALAALEPGDAAVDAQSFGAWLAEHGQSRSIVDALWDLIGIATLNARADDASLALAATVFQIGLLSDPGAADIGWSDVPLARLHGVASAAALRRVGADVRLRARVDAMASSPDGGWTVDLAGGAIECDAVIVAADPVTTERIVPAAAVGMRSGWSARLAATPIVNVHLVFNCPRGRVLVDPLLACAGSTLQWLFDRTHHSGAHRIGEGIQHVVASISAADDLVGRPVAELRAMLLPELHRVLPAARDAELIDFFVTREPHATWRQAPGSGTDRPVTATGLPGLALAGAHTATGWPATMEGAVRSGHSAADHVLSSAAGVAHRRSVAA